MRRASAGGARSFLYVPANRPEMLEKSLGRGADALIVDLEDAVPASEKDSARRLLTDFVRRHADDTERPEIWVRTNPGADAVADLESAVLPGVEGLCLAKADLAQVEGLLPQLDRLEHDRGAVPLRLSPLLETAAAVLDAPAIARAPRVVRLQVGEADLAAELGLTLGADEREFWWVRSQVVLASSAAGIEAPVGPVSTNFTDLDALRSSTQTLARMGYRGRCCIHPNQLAVVNEVFTPTSEEITAAARLLAAFEAAGHGVFIAEDGRMVDEAVIRSARRVLAASGE